MAELKVIFGVVHQLRNAKIAGGPLSLLPSPSNIFGTMAVVSTYPSPCNLLFQSYAVSRLHYTSITANLCTGLLSVLPFAVCTVALRILPSFPLKTSWIRPLIQVLRSPSATYTKSPSATGLLSLNHFVLLFRVGKYSCCQGFQNSSVRNCVR